MYSELDVFILEKKSVFLKDKNYFLIKKRFLEDFLLK